MIAMMVANGDFLSPSCLLHLTSVLLYGRTFFSFPFIYLSIYKDTDLLYSMNILLQSWF